MWSLPSWHWLLPRYRGVAPAEIWVGYTLEMSVMRSSWISILAFAFCLGVADGKLNAAPLHDAARTGDVDKVKQLLAQGSDVNGRDENRETPLIEAALADQAKPPRR